MVLVTVLFWCLPVTGVVSTHVLVLLNPTTREFVQLPEPNYYPETSNEESFESTCSRNGVGYDSVTDDYKVISLTYFHHDFHYHHDIDHENSRTTTCYVYSLRSNTWGQLNIDSPYYFNNSPAVYVNGFLYWVAEKSDHDSWAIVAFSLADECFSEVPSPGSCNDREIMPNRKSKLFVLDGMLAIMM
uniref:putative F-box protein At3g16210 n=1 Tax=Erigeron canadensis TaxID=72917 RepID=UPI001CB9CF5D|nr:putative F-box protein At3g16210 [Erigeron canadensis]